MIDAAKPNGRGCSSARCVKKRGSKRMIGVPIDTIEYWFFRHRHGKRTRFHKSVHWFLMKYLSGEVSDHDHEVLEARWLPE